MKTCYWVPIEILDGDIFFFKKKLTQTGHNIMSAFFDADEIVMFDSISAVADFADSKPLTCAGEEGHITYFRIYL